MPGSPIFLLVDDNKDNRFLLNKTLLRKFPDAVIRETDELEAALKEAVQPWLTAAVVHRAVDADGLSLIRALREANQALPILYVSGANHREEAFASGANAFLLYDGWLRVGTVVTEMLRTDTAPPFAAP